jgi:hypothetical protein
LFGLRRIPVDKTSTTGVDRDPLYQSVILLIYVHLLLIALFEPNSVTITTNWLVYCVPWVSQPSIDHDSQAGQFYHTLLTAPKPEQRRLFQSKQINVMK